MTEPNNLPITPNPEWVYSGLVSVSFEMQFTFQEGEFQQAKESHEIYVDPTSDARVELENELTAYLS